MFLCSREHDVEQMLRDLLLLQISFFFYFFVRAQSSIHKMHIGAVFVLRLPIGRAIYFASRFFSNTIKFDFANSLLLLSVEVFT